MENYFICPQCRKKLVEKNKVKIRAVATDGTEGTITLSPELGDYTVEYPESLTHKTGDLLSLYCPVCLADLASAKHVNLAMILSSNRVNEDFEIYFSRIVGEHSTLKIMGDHVDLFGEHASRYQDLFGNRVML